MWGQVGWILFFLFECLWILQTVRPNTQKKPSQHPATSLVNKRLAMTSQPTEIFLVISANISSFPDLWIILLTFTQVFCHRTSLLCQFLAKHFTNKPFASSRAGLGTVSIATVVAHSFRVSVVWIFVRVVEVLFHSRAGTIHSVW